MAPDESSQETQDMPAVEAQAAPSQSPWEAHIASESGGDPLPLVGAAFAGGLRARPDPQALRRRRLMAGGNGTTPPGSAEKSLGEIVNEVSEKATLLVREEIELAKAEIQLKVTRIAKGAALAAVGGVFMVLGAHLLPARPLMVLGGPLQLERHLARLPRHLGHPAPPGRDLRPARVRFFKKGTPPKPELAIEEAKKTRAVLEEARQLMAARSPEEIRASLQSTRTELEYSLNDLQGKVRQLTNWRRQLVENRQTAIIGAAVAGFLIGGGVAATFGLFRRR